MEARSRRQPVDFRREEVSYVMQRWRASDSCSLIGVGSVGKSNLLKHLADVEVQAAYLNIRQPDQFKSIVIDPNLLGPLPSKDHVQERCWAGYELMMHRLFMAFYPFSVLGDEDARRFYDTYSALQDGSNPLYAYMGLRYFERGLDFFMRQGIQIVFMFDEFEEMLKHLPPKFFQTLRGLRDSHKSLLSFLTFTRAPLPNLVDQYQLPSLALEPFLELFTDSMYYVGPYNSVDAQRMLENLMSRNNKSYPDATLEFLLWATGSYAGLIRSGFRLLEAIGPISQNDVFNDEMVTNLAMRRSIRIECNTIWSSLTSAEQHVLRAIVGLEQYASNTETEQAVAMLVQKRLIQVDKMQQTLHIQPPVFRVFVKQIDVEE